MENKDCLGIPILIRDHHDCHTEALLLGNDIQQQLIRHEADIKQANEIRLYIKRLTPAEFEAHQKAVAEWKRKGCPK